MQKTLSADRIGRKNNIPKGAFMKGINQEVLEKSAVAYVTVPLYLAGEKNKQDMAYALIDMIDALDEVEFGRSGTPLYDIIRGDMPGKRKEAIMTVEREYGLTAREGHILRFLSNGRNPTYIANALNISKTTVKAHKYNIFKKLGIHSTKELNDLLGLKNDASIAPRED